MFTKEGTQVTIHDYVPASTVEPGDQVAYENDILEVKEVVDSGESILIRGYSHVSGDTVTYIIGADVEVGLWLV